MLTKWKVDNFKSFGKDTDLDLAPLTILTGANSSGKSSFIQSILLVAQTMKHQDKSQPVIFNGEFVHLGSSGSIKYNGSANDVTKIGFSLAGTLKAQLASISAIRCVFSFDVKNIPYVTNKRNIRLLQTEISFIKEDDKDKYENKIIITRGAHADEELDYNEKYNIKKASVFPGSFIVFENDENKKSYIDDRMYKVDHQVKNIYSIIPNTERDENIYGCDNLYNFLPVNFFVTWYNSILKKTVGYELPIYGDLDMTVSDIQGFQKTIKYIGPLREDPKPTYPAIQLGQLNDVGIKGENIAYVLSNEENSISYIHPDQVESGIFLDAAFNKYDLAKSNEKIDIDLFPGVGIITDAVSAWLRYLGIADSVRVDYIKQADAYLLTVQKDGKDYKLNEVGVGVSQLLPILVMCLAAEEGDTLIIEQPELHLHPKTQSLLANFFLSMAKCGKQCIIETHSEYLINKLRYFFVLSEKSLKDDVKIYFAEKPDPITSFTEIKINDYGVMDKWPDGFFDESQELADKMLDAIYEKRKKNGLV